MSNNLDNNDEISLRELVYKVGSIWSYLIRKWPVILLVGIIGAGMGLTYAWIKPVKYTSRISFVVEDSKSGMGGLASLAGQFGFDFGSATNGGIFSGDNILLFLKSESLCREALLSNYDSAGKELLVDRYADAGKLKPKWLKNNKIGRINFSQFKNGSLPRLEDSLLQVITKQILKTDLEISKPDKKATFVEVNVTMRDELLSKYFGERLVQIATDRYLESKTKLKAMNVAKLQHRADSLADLLNKRTYSAAASQQSLVDINPALRMAPVASEITARDKTIVATIYGEVVKNLELSKVVLSQETPSIQVVDQSTLPLKKEKASKAIFTILGGALASLLCIATLLFLRWKNEQLGGTGKKSRRMTPDNESKVRPKAYSSEEN